MLGKPKLFARVLTICLILIGISSLILRHTLFFEKNQFINGWVLLVGAALLLFPMTRPSLRKAGLSTLLFTVPLAFSSYFNSDFLEPDHHTGIYFVVAGLALAILLLKEKWAAGLSQLMALGVGAGATLSFLSFLYKVNTTDGRIAFSYMSPGVAACLILLSLIILAEEPKEGFMRTINSPLTGGQVLRVLIPVTVLMPIVLGMLRTWAVEARNLNARFGTTMLLLFMILLMVAAIWYTAILINRRELQRLQIAGALKASQQELEAIFNNAPDTVVVINGEGMIVRWNKAAEQLFGYQADEVLGLSLGETIVPPQFREAHSNGMSRYLQTGVSKIINRTLEIQAYRKDHGITDISMRISPYQLNEATYFVGFIRDITQQKEEERQKKLAEQKFSGLFESAPYANIITDDSGLIQYSNEEVTKLLGFTPIELQEQKIDLLLSIDFDAVEAGELTVMENRIRKKDGTDFPAELRFSPFYSENGTIYSAVVLDITGRKENEARLNAFNEQLSLQVKSKTKELQEVLERLSDGFVGLDKDLRFTYVNRRAGQLSRLAPAEMVGKLMAEVFPGIEQVDSYKALQTALKSQLYTTSVDYFEPLKLYHENHIYPSPDGLSVFIRDVTAKRKTEQALKQSIQRYKTFIEEAVDAIVVYSPALGRYTDVNRKAAELLGYEVNELLDMKPENLLAPESESIIERLDTGTPLLVERVLLRKDGTKVEVETSAVKLSDGSYLAFMRNISERKKSEKEMLRLNEELRKLGNYLQEVREAERVHIAREIHDELGQQMTVLKMDTVWIKKNLGKVTDDKIKDKVNELTSMIDTAVVTIRKIASELRPSLLDDIGLVAAMEWHLGEFSKRTGISVRSNIVNSDLVLPDSAKTNIFRILQEALTNVARHSQAKEVNVNFSVIDNHVQLEIADNGKGFNPSRAGRTLGLLGMRERAHMIGAEYDINSAPGRGTRVQVSYRI